MRSRFMKTILIRPCVLSVAGWLSDSSQKQCRILRAERNAIAHSVFDLMPAPCVGNVVEITVGIGIIKIDGGRNLRVMHSDEGSSDSRSSAGPLRMPDLGLQR